MPEKSVFQNWTGTICKIAWSSKSQNMLTVPLKKSVGNMESIGIFILTKYVVTHPCHNLTNSDPFPLFQELDSMSTLRGSCSGRALEAVSPWFRIVLLISELNIALLGEAQDTIPNSKQLYWREGHFKVHQSPFACFFNVLFFYRLITPWNHYVGKKNEKYQTCSPNILHSTDSTSFLTFLSVTFHQRNWRKPAHLHV